MSFDVKDNLLYLSEIENDKDIAEHDYTLRQIKFEFINFDRECVYDDCESPQVRRLLAKTISFASVLFEELKFYKKTLYMKEIQIDAANQENFELGEECNRLYEMLTELNEKNRQNEMAQREKLAQQEVSVDMMSDMHKLQKLVNELEKNIKIVEIERDEAFWKSEELEKKLENQANNMKISNKLVKDLERQIKNLKRKNDDNEKKLNTYSRCVTSENISPSRDGSDNLSYSPVSRKNLYTESTKFASFRSDENNYNFSKDYHTRSLSVLLPDIFEEENEEKEKTRISLTSKDVLKHMSDKIKKTPFTQKEKPTNKSKNDIYKDFFLLTFQSLKLNSKNIESYINVNPELLYEEIINKNIPFHEFGEFILNQTEKSKKTSFFGNFKQIFDYRQKK